MNTIATAAPPLCHKCGVPMTLRTAKHNKFNKFWGCSQYPTCWALQSLNGKQYDGSPPTRKDQKEREQHNREVSHRLTATHINENDTECPFDDVPGPNDGRTAFGRIGGDMSVVERVAEMDAEFREIVG